VTERYQYKGLWEVNQRKWIEDPLEFYDLQKCEGIARAILVGSIPDPTGGATHFHRVGTPTPSWAPPEKEWRRIGRHYFYKERKP